MAERNRRHLKVERTGETLSFKGHGRGKPNIYRRDREQHARLLQEQLSKVETEFGRLKQIREEARLSTEFGLILNVESEPQYPLDFTKLERAQTRSADGIVLLNVRMKETASG